MSESNVFPGNEEPADPRLAVPRPSALGTFFLLAAFAALGFGVLRGELAAILWGFTILFAESYAFLAVTLASALRRSTLHGYTCRIEPVECNQGDRISVRSGGPARFRPPLALVRFRIDLRTADGRRTVVAFDPERSSTTTFPAGERGAYFAARDRLELIDAFAFFRASYGLKADAAARLLVRPAPNPAEARAPDLSGGDELRIEQTFRRTDDLTDNRRYVPGDDPRRINWKIYGHAGELFVREGESEPPPRSRIVILVDASVDSDLFDADSGRSAVDGLAQRALGLVDAVIAAGYEARFGFNGSDILSGNALSAARAFAFPAALRMDAAPPLPTLAQTDGGAVVLALPRNLGVPSALEKFLQDPRRGSETEIIFVAPTTGNAMRRRGLGRLLIRPESASSGPNGDPVAMERALRECRTAYGGRSGVHARSAEN